MKRLILSLLLTIWLITSCAMIPEYQRPENVTANVWMKSEHANIQEQKVPESELATHIPWRDFFISEELRKVIELALENNKDLKTAILNIQKAKATYNIQEANSYPHLDGIVDTDLKGNFASKHTELYQGSLASTSYELDLFGRVKSLEKAALNEYLATKEAKNAATISLIAETAKSYIQLISDIESFKLAEETLAIQQKSYNLIQQSYDYGVATRLDLAQIRTAVETARVNKVLYSRKVILDRNTLNALLGTTNTNTLPLANKLEDIVLLQDIPVGLPSQVLLKRPDIRQAEYKLKAAGANIGAARAAFYPRISLTGNLGFSSDELSKLFASSNTLVWSFLPSLTVPIFNFGENQAKLEIAEIDQKLAITQYEKTIQQAFKEVADELITRDTISQQLVAQKALVQANQEAYHLSKIRYKQGIDDFLNVLDAQRNLFTAQQTAIQIKKSNLENQIKLYKVLGGGLAEQR